MDIRSRFSPNSADRRKFLQTAGMGFGSVALTAMLQRERARGAETLPGWAPPNGEPHFPPKARNVIWLFMLGGMSHIDTFDPKPALNQYAGMTIEDTPFKGVLDNPTVKKNVQEVVAGRKLMKKIFPMQVSFRKYGQSGVAISDWWPHVGGMADDLAIVRSMWLTDNDHGAQVQFHQGRHMFDGYFPSIGAWVHYGLGSLNENLPQFVVLGETQGGNITRCHQASYLGPQHAGVNLKIDPANPLPYASPGRFLTRDQQRRELGMIQAFNRLDAERYAQDGALQARIKSYELAFRMQSEVPKVFQFSEELASTNALYGLDQAHTKPFGEVLLTARRLVERGVRFVQVYHLGSEGVTGWDAHSKLKENHTRLCAAVDRPIAGLLTDLKQRGLLQETVVVFATEFGRTPGVEGESGGRDHHPFGFSIWMAGGGLKPGVYGATDELGFHAVEQRHYVTDVHHTLLHQLGLDPRKLDIPGFKRIEMDYGEPIRQMIG